MSFHVNWHPGGGSGFSGNNNKDKIDFYYYLEDPWNECGYHLMIKVKDISVKCLHLSEDEFRNLIKLLLTQWCNKNSYLTKEELFKLIDENLSQENNNKSAPC